MDLLPGLRSLTVAGGQSVLCLLLEEPLEALTEFTAFISCDLETYIDTHRDVQKLRKRRPNARVDLRVSVRYPAERRYQWGQRWW